VTYNSNTYYHRAKLTKPEQEVCDLHLKGMSRKEIAALKNMKLANVSKILTTPRATTYLSHAREQIHGEALNLVADAYKQMTENLLNKMKDPKTNARDLLDGWTEITDRLQVAGLIPKTPTESEGASDFGMLIAPTPAPVTGTDGQS